MHKSTHREATRKALYWLKLEIESVCDNKISLMESNEIEDADDHLEKEELQLCTGIFTSNKLWSSLDDEVKKLAIQIARFAVKAALSYALKSSSGGLLGA